MSLMQQEILQTPAAIACQLRKNQEICQAISQRLQQTPITFAMTIARGSSDHAASFAKYLFETLCDWPTVSAAPSVYTIYKRELLTRNALVVGLSQSGESPDLIETMAASRRQGALTVAVVNEHNSPLAQIAEYVLPIWAEPECAVAATKSYVGSLFAILHMIAVYKQDQDLLTALESMPAGLKRASECQWPNFIEAYKNASSALVIGRGYSFPVALEAALKFKETCILHAEAFSSAEILHGPFALVRTDLPVMVFGQHDAAWPSTVAVCEHMRRLGAKLLIACPQDNKLSDTMPAHECVKVPAAIHPLLDPLQTILAFYHNVAQLAVVRGFDPDQPANLQKITRTR